MDASPQAGAIALVKYESAIPSVEIAERVRVSQSTLIVPGSHVGLEGYLRIWLGGREEFLREGLRRIGHELRRYSQRRIIWRDSYNPVLTKSAILRNSWVRSRFHMAHRVRQGFLRTLGTVVLLLALTHSATAAQRPSGPSACPAPPSAGQAASTPAEASPDATAEQTRGQLELIGKIPPAVGRVLKLDPSLMSNPAYMLPYPLLATYLAQHQEIAHNPGYFLENVNSPNQYTDFSRDPKWRQRQESTDCSRECRGFWRFSS